MQSHDFKLAAVLGEVGSTPCRHTACHAILRNLTAEELLSERVAGEGSYWRRTLLHESSVRA